jgi:hypothetical protein
MMSPHLKQYITNTTAYPRETQPAGATLICIIAFEEPTQYNDAIPFSPASHRTIIVDTWEV